MGISPLNGIPEQKNDFYIWIVIPDSSGRGIPIHIRGCDLPRDLVGRLNVKKRMILTVVYIRITEIVFNVKVVDLFPLWQTDFWMLP